MAADVGIKLKIEGEKEYRQSLQNIISSQKEWESEIKAVDSALESEGTQEDKNRKKGELLAKSIDSQEEKLDLMRKQLVKVEEAYGEDSKQAKDLRTNINKATTALNKMKSEAQTLAPKMKKIGDTMQKVGKKMQTVGTNMSKYVTAPLTALAASSVAAFSEVDSGLDIVTKKTGATGQALTELQESARNVATTIPTSFETAGSAIGEVNTKFGLVGDDLESLSVKFIKFADLNDTDVSSAIDNTQKVMAAFGLKTEDTEKILDTMNATGQATGISMDTLSSTMVKNAAALKDMGLNAYDATQFLGQVEMSGANTSEVMTGMKKAMTEAAKDGKTLPEKLAEFQDIMNSSATDTEKLNAAIDTFGSKAGPAIFEACNTGSLNLESFSGDIDRFAGNIDQTYSDVKGANNDLETSFNKIKDAGSRIGEVVLEAIAPAVSDIADLVEKVGDAYASMDTDQQKFVLAAVGAFGLGGPVVSAMGKTVESAGKIAVKVGNLASKIGEASGLASGFGEAAGTLAGAGGPIGVLAATVAGASYVVYRMSKKVETSNERIKTLAEAQEGNLTALDEAVKSMNEALDSGNQSINEINEQASVALSMVDELEKLEKQSNRTTAEEARMQAIVDTLNDMYPDLKVSIDRSTGAINKSTKEIKNYIKNAKNLALLEAYTRASAEAMDAFVKANNELYKAQKGKASLEEQAKQARLSKAALEGLQKSLVDTGWDYTKYSGQIQDANDNINYLEDAIAESNEAIAEQQKAVEEAQAVIDGYSEQMDLLSSEVDEETDELEKNTGALDDNTAAADANKKTVTERAKAVAEKTREALAQLREEQAEWDSLYNATKESIQGQVKLFEEWKNDSEVTFESMLANMKSQKRGLKNYTENLRTLSKAAADSGNENFKALVRYIADMGVEGAQYADELVKTMTTDKDEFNRIVREFGYTTGWEDNLAGIIAYIQNDFASGIGGSMAIVSKAAESGFESTKEDITKTYESIWDTLKSGSKSVEEAAEDNYKAGQTATSAISSGALSKMSEVGVAVGKVTGEVEGISGDVDNAAKDIKKSSSGSVLGLIAGMALNKILLKATAAGIVSEFTGMATSVNGKKETLKKSGQGSVESLSSGVDSAVKSDLEPAEKRVLTSVKTTTVTIDKMQSDFLDSGRMVVKGLTTGMDYEAENAYKKAIAIANAIKTHINNALKVKSPSRVTMETGRYVAEGLALGMEKQMPEVQKASVMLGRAAIPFGATQSDVIQIRAEAFGGLDVDSIYSAVRSGAMDGQQPVIISEKSFKRALVGMGVKVA